MDILLYSASLNVLLLVVIAFLTYRNIKQLKNINKLLAENGSVVDLNRALNSKMKSEQVRLGKIMENLYPLSDIWPYDSKLNFKFIGGPVDGIDFGDDKITFVEVKTGNSSMTKKQRHIKKLIEEGKVGFDLLTLGEYGVINYSGKKDE